MKEIRFIKVWLALGIIYLGFIIGLSLTPSPPKGPEIIFFDKAAHLAAYFVLMFYFSQLINKKLFWLAIGFILLGAGLEILQGLGGIRQAETADAAANTLGVLLGLALGKGKAGGMLERFVNRK